MSVTHDFVISVIFLSENFPFMDKFLDIPTKDFGYVYKAITRFHIFIRKTIYLQ